MTRLGDLYHQEWEQCAYKPQMASSPLLLYLLHNVRTNTGELYSRPFGGGSWPEPDHADSGLLVSITMTVASQFLLVFCFYLFLRSYQVLYKSWQQSKQNKTMIWLFLLIRFVAILSAASHSSRRWAQERGYCLTQSSHGILSNKKDYCSICSLYKDFPSTTE